MSDYREWAALLGKTSVDEEVCEAFKRAGFKKPPRIPRSDREEIEDFDGMSAMIVHPIQIKSREYDLPKGAGVLYAISMWLVDEDELYEGELPHGLAPDDDQAAVHAKLGKPLRQDDEEESEVWSLEENRELEVRYQDGRLRDVSVKLPASWFS